MQGEQAEEANQCSQHDEALHFQAQAQSCARAG